VRRSRHVKEANGDVPPIAPSRVIADPRKFTEYVLVPGHSTGKDRIFIDRLGYRPRSEEDARNLVETYVAQARERITARTYELGEADEFGQRLTIEIELRGTTVLSGWILRPDGTLWLATPFTGFARS
jgi:uncharacterized protein DUF6883